MATPASYINLLVALRSVLYELPRIHQKPELAHMLAGRTFPYSAEDAQTAHRPARSTPRRGVPPPQ